MAEHDYCLMAPYSPKYSNISEEDFALLITHEITPQIAGQWLYNVKSFRFESEITRDYFDPSTPDETENVEWNYEIWSYDGVTYGGLKIRPLLRILTPDYFDISPDVLPIEEFDNTHYYLKPSISNEWLWYDPTELANINQYLGIFYFFKRLDKWYIGVKEVIYSGSTYTSISATMDTITTSSVDASDSGYVTNYFSNTYTITGTTY
jgi:hypothetical protein